MKSSILSLLAGVALLFSCSEYQKVLRSDDYIKKYNLANEMFERKKYLQSLALYEQVYQRMPKSPEGEQAYFNMGKGYFEEGDYYMAGYYFSTFFDRFNHSTKVEEAYFMKAICSVKSSPEPSLDQAETMNALSDLQQFIYLFPNSTRIDTCNRMMDRLRVKIEEKEYDAVKLYHHTLNYRAAVTSSEVFLKEFPKSQHREEVMYLNIKNAYELAVNSVDNKKKERIEKAIETYRTFVAQFPDSKYLRESKMMEERLQDELKSITNSK